jgi:hypothetical protein
MSPLPRLLLNLEDDGWDQLTTLQRYQLEGALRTALIQAIAGLLLVVGAVTAFRQYALARTQAAADRSAKYVDAFTKAVEQLESSNGTTSIAGVYALDRLAQTNDIERTRISEILAAFVRGSRGSISSVALIAAIRCLSFLRHGNETIDLTGAYLAGLDLRNLNLSYFIFDECDLRDADLTNSKVYHASFARADTSRMSPAGRAHINTRVSIGL